MAKYDPHLGFLLDIPLITDMWTKKGPQNARLTFSLLIFFQQVKTSDAGSYSVLASNTAGAAECMAVIGVKGKCWEKKSSHFFLIKINLTVKALSYCGREFDLIL